MPEDRETADDREAARRATRKAVVIAECEAEMVRTDENLGEEPTEGDYLADVERRFHTLVWHRDGEANCSECYPLTDQCAPPARAAETWPVTAAENDDFRDWQYEVGNGDTVLGYREWVTHRVEDFEPDPADRRPSADCGCSYTLIWVDGHWEHHASPSMWGDDHDADAPEPATDDPVRMYWDKEDGVTE